jgi:hypothetical protein
LASCARRLPVRAFDCFLFGTAMVQLGPASNGACRTAWPGAAPEGRPAASACGFWGVVKALMLRPRGAPVKRQEVRA